MYKVKELIDKGLNVKGLDKELQDDIEALETISDNYYNDDKEALEFDKVLAKELAKHMKEDKPEPKKESAPKETKKFEKPIGKIVPVLSKEEERDEFVEYVSGFYGKDGIYKNDYNGGFTKSEIEDAVDKYMNNKNTVWGGGDSTDRELMRDRYLIKKESNTKPEKTEKAKKPKKAKGDKMEIPECDDLVKKWTDAYKKRQANKDKPKPTPSEKFEKKADSVAKTLVSTVKGTDKELKAEAKKDVKVIIKSMLSGFKTILMEDDEETLKSFNAELTKLIAKYRK